MSVSSNSLTFDPKDCFFLFFFFSENSEKLDCAPKCFKIYVTVTAKLRWACHNKGARFRWKRRMILLSLSHQHLGNKTIKQVAMRENQFFWNHFSVMNQEMRVLDWHVNSKDLVGRKCRPKINIMHTPFYHIEVYQSMHKLKFESWYPT